MVVSSVPGVIYGRGNSLVCDSWIKKEVGDVGFYLIGLPAKGVPKTRC